MASAACVIEMLPDYVKGAWTLQHDHAGHLCDKVVVDLIRAMATRSSWAKIAAVLNELRATRTARLDVKYMVLCGALGVVPLMPANHGGGTKLLDRKWVARVYEHDSAARELDTVSELLAEQPAHVLAMDWTHDAGTRCQGKWMFNIASADGKVLSSVVTRTTAPLEVEPVLRDLHLRGARPTVIYVDCECCGAWKPIIEQLWPDAKVLLDSFHAMRRLTQTTSSTKHPWHAQFCKRISEAMFDDDEQLSARFNKAFKRSNLSPKARARLRTECVTRRIKDKNAIDKSIEDVIAEYTVRVHPTFGPLLTPKTLSAWSALRLHVRKGCLCDPPGVDLYAAQGKPIVVGGERLTKFKSMRGSSALEGFHGIQKSWLGQQSHSRKRGLALVADGTVRHNRKRRNQMVSNLEQTPPVYAAGLLSPTDSRHRSFIENGVRQLLAQSVAHARPPVRDTNDDQVYELKELLTTSASRHQSMAGSPTECEQAAATHESAHKHCNGVTAELVAPVDATDLCPSSADEMRAADNVDTSTEAAPATVKRRLRQQKASADKMNKHKEKQQGFAHQEVLPAASVRSGCRTCRMIGTKCRLYKRIQWCVSSDPPFEEWLVNEFHTKKVAALKRTLHTAARRGKPKGRPAKRKES